jgi:hypothetical protein
MKYIYETIEIEGLSVVGAILALQAWKDKNPAAIKNNIN